LKTIFLVRHGKAVSRDTDIPDYNRTLLERGRENSLQVARRLKKQKIKPSLIISSPAPRALGTARIFARQLGYNPRSIRTRKAIYDQTDGTLLNIVREIDEECDNVILIGHNPSINDFALFLTGNFNKDMPTCGLVGIKLKTGTWKEIAKGGGKLKIYDFPKPENKSKIIKSFQKDLEKILTAQIGRIIGELDAAIKEKIEKPVKKSSKKLAKAFVKKIKSTKDKKKRRK
jgi:phosphohistidine phosphatase